MADCSFLFREFHNKLVLPSEKREAFKKVRHEIQRVISAYFQSENISPPSFKDQGAWAIDTVLNSSRPNEYNCELSSGIYLNHFIGKRKEWPAPETVHQMVSQALNNFKTAQGHTPELKTEAEFLRLDFEDYQIALPIYNSYKKKNYLGVQAINSQKGGWIEGEADGLAEWFNERARKHNQLPHNVIYWKAWAARNDSPLTGILSAVLVGEFFEADSREDVSFVNICNHALFTLGNTRAITNPINPDHNMLRHWKPEQIDRSLTQLQELCEHASRALRLSTRAASSEHWKKVFGAEFV